jgi:hypothetical protein
MISRQAAKEYSSCIISGLSVRKGELGSCNTTAQWMRCLGNDWLPLRKQVMAIQPFYRFFIEIGMGCKGALWISTYYWLSSLASSGKSAAVSGASTALGCLRWEMMADSMLLQPA